MTRLMSATPRRKRVTMAAAVSATALLAVSYVTIAGSPAGASAREGSAQEGSARNLDGGLLLDRGALKRLPDVPDSAQTVHFRNNNRGDVVGTYATGDVAAPDTIRLRGFILRAGRLTKIDVPGARFSVPLGVNDRGQVVGGYANPDAVQDPVTGEYTPTHAFVWQGGRVVERFDAPGAGTTAAYEINNLGQIVGDFPQAGGAK